MSAAAGATTDDTSTETCNLSNIRKLYWFKSKLNGQLLDCVLDSAATITCIAKRCVTSNPTLKRLRKFPYNGSVLGANKQPLDASYFIRAHMVVGSPAVSVDVTMLIVNNLPYSCLVGTDVLSKFDRWSVDNLQSTLMLNNSSVPIYDQPLSNHSVNLITTSKCTISPGESIVIRTIASGPGVDANRPLTCQTIMSEGVEEREMRTKVRVFPSIHNIGENNNTEVFIRATNTSNQSRTVGKGVKIAEGHNDFVMVTNFESQQSVNVVNSDVDVLDIILNRSDVIHLSDSEFAKARNCLSQFRDVFSVSNEIIGRAKNCIFDVDSNIQPVSVPLRRTPMHKEQIVKQLLTKYKELGLIEEIDSPFRAATVLVEKKNPGGGSDVTDQYRLVVDYRVLNKFLPDSAWPAPAIDYCLDAAADSVLFSSLDFNNGYYQIPCSETAKYTLAFSPGVGFGQYTFTGMPPGVKPAASFFQQSMEKTFRGLESCILPPYFDDVNIKGYSFDDHLKKVKLVLTQIRKSGFTLNALKCRFFQIRMKYLGHIVENGSVSIDPDRVKAIVDLPAPRNVKEVRRFIGMVQFCNRFVSNLNDRLSPLYNLLRKDISFNWSVECDQAFKFVKDTLSNPPVLRCPKSGDHFVLETDSSDVGIGACLKVLSQGKEYIVAYHSGKLHEAQCRWHIVEKEAHAILEGVKKFRHYLIGKRFTLKTDNRILSYLNTSKSKKLANWALQLSDYTFDVVHIPAKDNAISDLLSRVHEVNAVTKLSSSIDWRAAQRECPFINAAIAYLQCKSNFDVTRLGPLKRFRKFLSLDKDDILRWKDKIVVPEKLRSNILELSHEHPTAGHFADDRTWKTVTQNYFWPNLHNDVSDWIRSCNKCNDFNISTYVNRPLNPIDSSGRFEIVCYDLAGPFVPSRGHGNTYALIIVDHFTKWPELIPMKCITAPNIARTIFEEWCCRYGVMTQLHSDGAQNMHGNVIKELCNFIGTVKSKSSRLHPQGDGMSEAMVKIMKNAVKKQVDQYGRDWDTYLQSTALAIRSSINYSTKFTPAELMIGENLVRPIDISANRHENRSFSSKQAKEFARSLTKKIDDSSKAVVANLQTARNKMKTIYDKKNSYHRFSEGDYVMLWWPYTKKGISRAFQPKWKGPFKIIKIISDSNCTIELHNGERKHVHMNQLKPVLTRDHSFDRRVPQGSQNGPESVEDLFDELGMDSVENDVEIRNDDDRWCGLSDQNVIMSRTRSGNVGGGDG